MAIKPAQPSIPTAHTDRPVPAVGPVAPAQGAHRDPGTEQESESESDRARRHEHARHLALQAHAAGRGPMPRARRSTAQKAQRNRRRRRADASAEDDDLHLPETEEHHVDLLSIVTADSPSDGGDDHGEGGEERSRHERLGRIQYLAERGDEEDIASGTEDVHEAPAAQRAPGSDVHSALSHFVRLSVDIVAHWRPGDPAALQLQCGKLALLEATRHHERLDQGGLARVAQHLRTASHAVAGGANPALNRLLPLLLLQLQLRRTRRQAEEAIARLKVALHPR